MNLPKLIASDLDGTLVPEGAGSLPPELTALLDEIQGRGIPFAVSSGRQAESLRRVFASLRHPPLILALNGGALFRGGELLYQDPLPRQEALDIAAEAAAMPGVHVILETAHECWVYGPDSPLMELLPLRQYHVAALSDLSELEGEVIKVACHSAQDIAGLERWALSRARDGIRAARSGAEWVDFNVSDKGKGLRAICALLGIDPADTLAFGDNFNDAPLLDAAGTGWAVAGSILAGAGGYPVCQDVASVLRTLRDELRAQELRPCRPESPATEKISAKPEKGLAI